MAGSLASRSSSNTIRHSTALRPHCDRMKGKDKSAIDTVETQRKAEKTHAIGMVKTQRQAEKRVMHY